MKHLSLPPLVGLGRARGFGERGGLAPIFGVKDKSPELDFYRETHVGRNQPDR
jgi:hypothetical protein